MMDAILNILPCVVVVLNSSNQIIDANSAAENFFELSIIILRKHKISDLFSSNAPILEIVAQARQQKTALNEYGILIRLFRTGAEKLVDLFTSPIHSEPFYLNPNQVIIDGSIVVMLTERTLAQKINRQLVHRDSTRSISALSAILAHEIKNPLSGIRGAAQLLESSLNEDDRVLTQLICDETDRIVRLVERFETFSDARPIIKGAVNIHSVLDHVKRIASSGFAQDIAFHEIYDPSLPHVDGNSDLLIQVFLNLVKNAAEAIHTNPHKNSEIILTTAYKPSMRMSVPGSAGRVELPLEICVRDTGGGIAPELMPVLFDPFVTTKESGSGLGLAMVAKIIGDHGGIVECEPTRHETVFRILLPVYHKQ